MIPESITALEIVLYVVVFIAGSATAIIYLWLLHLSVGKIVRDAAPSLLAFVGFFFRIFLCGASFFLCSLGGRFDRLAVSVIGFAIMRLIAINVIRSFPTSHKPGEGPPR
ncbi:MAG: ATP synthase subunit I [Spirochaetota bacterium]